METIHSGRYIAEYSDRTAESLLVITRPKGGGKYITGEDATEWAEHIRTAIDKSEANALCRAILES